MKPELQDREDPLAGVLLDFGEPVDVPRVEHQRLFADRIRARAEREAAMRVMQVIRRADRDLIELFTLAPELVDMAVEALELGEEMRVRKMAVEDADRIIRIEGNDKIASGLLDGLHVTGSDVAGGSDKCI